MFQIPFKEEWGRKDAIAKCFFFLLKKAMLKRDFKHFSIVGIKKGST